MPLTPKLRAYAAATPPYQMSTLSQVSDWFRRTWDAIRDLQHGKMDVSRYGLMDHDAVFTEFRDVRLTHQSQVILSPMTVSAFLLYPSIIALEADRQDGFWRFGHDSSPATDMKFLITIIG